MTSKDVTNSVSKFGGILFNPIWNTAVFWYAVEPWRSGFLCVARMDPLHLLNPSKNPHLCQHIGIAQFFQRIMLFKTQLALVCHVPCSPLWVEISTLAYEMNSSCWPERLSVANSTHIIQTKLMLKIRRYPSKIDVYSYRRAHRCASCSAEVICRGCRVVTCITQPSVY
jgi:hypothetical protein